MSKDERREASTKRMHQAAMQEFALRGFSGARIESMANEAGVSKGLISQRFGTKEALYVTLYEDCFVGNYQKLIPEGGEMLPFLEDIVKIIKETAEKEPLRFSFICSFFNDSDVPEDCQKMFHHWFDNSGIPELMLREMNEGKMKSQDPFVTFHSFLRASCDITRCFLDANLALPGDENYLSLAGYRIGVDFIDREEQRRHDIINVLSSEYDAVYYVDAISHDYEVLFQRGTVKADLNQMLKALPKFDMAYAHYVQTFVHPDDQAMMMSELDKVYERLKKRKNFKAEFRRNMGDHYNYSEMNCVKVGEDEDELKAFVVGFVENDAVYRSLLDQQKQLEFAVAERTAELQERNRTLNKVNEDIIELLGNITEARDTESGEHIRRVKGFTHILAEQVMKDWPEYGITNDLVELMTSASALHDVGKIAIPDAILLKPGRLMTEEFEIMKSHCEKGAEILKNAPQDWSDSYKKVSMDICRYHHEKYDGSGYPLGLKGDEIPVSAQIVSIADCFDALSTKRVYKDAYPVSEAFNMILRGECGVYSDKMMASFKACKNELFKHAIDVSSSYQSALPMGISTASLSWTKILFVDDNDINREMSIEVLRSEGAEVTSAKSGREAVDLFRLSKSGTYDAILMDVMMPEMSGLEATALIRAMDRPDAKTVSIIALTSLTSENDVNRCLDAGMDSFITKPIVITSLNRVLYECMESHSEALGHAVHKADREAQERMDKVLENNSLFFGFRSDYDLLCYVNANTNDISGYRASQLFTKIIDGISHRLPSNRRLDQLFRRIIPQRDFQDFLNKTNRNRIIEYLMDHDSYHVFVPAYIEDRECLYRFRVVKDPEQAGCYIIGLQSVDAETKEEMRIYEMIQILSESYLIVDYVDLENDTYTRYQDNGFIPDSHSRHYFSEHVKDYVMSHIHPEDREMLLKNLTLQNVREQLLAHRRLTFRFRDMGSGKPVYLEYQIIQASEKEDGFHALMMISDIDEIVRNEAEQNARMKATERQLKEAERRSVRDELTGVKNITAYTESVAALSEMLLEDPRTEFAIMVCDIDGLKEINDRFSHKTGDIFIKNCCQIICDIFKHSPVFRIGGDEFAVLLKGVDYSNRDALMKELDDSIKEAQSIDRIEKGRAALSAGLGVYDPTKDETVAEVMHRADMAMYNNKNLKVNRK